MELDQKIKDSCFEFAEHPWAHGARWKDAKNYSQNDKERIPTVWSTKIGGCEILVMCSHIHYPNTWIMNCHELRIEGMALYHVTNKGNRYICETAKDAANLAFAHCKEKVADMYVAFSSHYPD